MDHGSTANWKGILKIGAVSCPVALYTAASTAERIALHIFNRKTGHRVHREFVDAETDERVETKDQVKGYQTDLGDYIVFEPEEIAKAVPEADKTLDVEAFVPKMAEPTKPSDLMEALRQSAEEEGEARTGKRKAASRQTTRSKTSKRRGAA